MSIWVRIICFLTGYACGLLETGVLYGKAKGVDIRKHGSGNSGTTNALRVLGPRAGIVVFIGDFCKAFLPCLAAQLIFRHIFPESYLVLVLYAGIGAVVGHNFPFYLKFHGGKGVAATAGLVVGLLDPVMTLILLAVFVVTVAVTKYVSVGSMVLMVAFSAIYIFRAETGRLCFVSGHPSSEHARTESIILILFVSVMTICRHRENIRRLMEHRENKLNFKAKPEVEKESEETKEGGNT